MLAKKVVDEQKSKCRKTLQENNTTEGTTSTSSGSSGGLQRRATLHITTEDEELTDSYLSGERPLRECNTLPSDAVVAVGVDEGGLIAVAPAEHFVAGLENMPPDGAEAAGPSGSGEEASQVVPDDAEEPASQMPNDI